MSSLRRFSLLTRILLLFAATTGAALAECAPPPRDAETVYVQHVHDGDTLILRDKRKLRLVGFNSPEVARRDRPAEPLAIKARDQLIRWIEESDREIRLQYDVDRSDRYGRLLAHAFLKNGRNIADLMLEEGLATGLIIPPNLQHADCYSSAERRARSRQQGVWRLPFYHPVGLDELTAHRDRYTVLRARVLDLEHDTKGFIIWLGADEHAPRIRVFIGASDLELFPWKRLKTLAGRTIEVRGWLHRRDKTWTLQLRHPSNLDFL